MLKFEKDKIYKFGILSSNGLDNPTAPNPDFTAKPAPVSMAGHLLIKQDIRTFDDFLEKNIMGYPTNKIVHCYLFDDKKYTKLAEGNPLPKTKSDPQDMGLSDNFYPMQNNSQQMMPYNNYPVKQQKIDYSNIEEIYSNRIAAMEIIDSQKEQRIRELLDKNIDLMGEIAVLKAKIMELDIEKQKLEGILNRLDEMGHGGGLNDNSGGIMQVVAPLMQDEQFVKGITQWVSNKLGFGQQQQMQQPVQQQGYVPIAEQQQQMPGGNYNANS